jgi:hypothetical protein
LSTVFSLGVELHSSRIVVRMWRVVSFKKKLDLRHTEVETSISKSIQWA